MRSSSARPIDETSFGVSAIFFLRLNAFRVSGPESRVMKNARHETGGPESVFSLIQFQESRGVFAHDFSFCFSPQVLPIENHIGNPRKCRVPVGIIRSEHHAIGADGFDDRAQASLIGFKRDKTLAAEVRAWFHLQP